MRDSTSVQIVLNWYELKGSSLIAEEPINDMSEEDVLNLFDAPFWNKLYHCWAIEPAHISELQKHVQHKINTKEYAYFVEIYKLNNV